MLRKNFFTAEQMIALIRDFRQAGLTAEESALMAFAQKIIAHPAEVDEVDINELHEFGLTDEDVLNVVLAVTARSFFSKTLDALDVPPDEIYHQLEPELVSALTIGRPFP